MADYNLGTAHGTVKIDSDTKGVDQASESLDKLGNKSDDASEKLGSIGTKTALAGAAIVGGLGVAVNSAANFEQRLSAIRAVSGATASEMDLIRDAALRIGKDTSFSATEAASAMEELSKAGISTNDILGGVADATVALAAAGEIDLPQAATIASNALNIFGLTAQDMTRVTDVLAQSANASAIDVSDMGMALSQAGAVANLVGLSFDDTAIAIGQLGDAGIRGSDAGTSLKTMLSNLQPATEAQATAMSELGLVTEDGTNQFFNANGELKSLREVQELLYNSTKDLTDAQKQQYLETIFGSDAIRAAAVLADGGAASYDNFAQKMTEAGTAQEVAATRMDNMKGSWEELTGSLETFAIQIGSLLIPAIRGIIDNIGAAVDWFTGLDDTWKELIVTVAAVLGVLLLVGGTILKVISWVKGFRTAILALNTAMKANPVLAIVSLILMLIAALVTAYQTSETFRNFVQAAFQAIADAGRWMWENVLKPVWEALQAAWQATWQFLVDTWENYGRPIWETIAELATWLWENILEPIFSLIWSYWQIVWGLVEAVWQAVIYPMLQLLGTVISWLWDAIIKPVLGFIGDAFMFLWDWVIKPILGLIALLLVAAWETLKWVWEHIIKPVLNFIGDALNWLADVMEGVADFVSDFWNNVGEVFEAAKEWISGVMSDIADWIGDRWDDIVGFFEDAAEAIGDALEAAWQFIQDVWNNIVEFFSGLGETIINFFSNAIQWLWNAGANIVTGLWNGIVSGIQTLWGWITEIGNTILNFFRDAGSWLLNAGHNLITGLWNGITNALSWLWQKLKDWAMSVVDNILGWFGISSPSKVFAEIGEFLMLGLGKGIDDEAITAVRAAEDAARSVVEALHGELADGASVQATVSGALTEGSAAALAGGARSLGGSAATAVQGASPIGATAASASQAAVDKEFQRIVNMEFNTYNPVAERASDNEARRIRAAAAVGSF